MDTKPGRLRGLFAVGLALLVLGATTAWSDVAEDLAASRQSAIVRAIDRASPAVVNIHSTQIVRRQVWNPFENFFGGGAGPQIREHRVQSLGSGCIFDARRGYVLTNEHVINGADEIHVGLQDGRTLEADVVGADEFSDVAVLKIEASNLPEATLGVSQDLRIGEWAIAIGNPFGYLVRDRKPTVTVGVISAKDRVVSVNKRTYADLVQTDASVNPGNSGGPLVNSAGEVIGINTFIFSESRGSNGVNFAISIDVVKKVVSDLVQSGRVVEPWVGLIYTQVEDTESNAAAGTEDGVVVTYVQEESPAASVGLRTGDIVTALNGRHVYEVEGARAALRLLRPGDSLTIDYVRGRTDRQVSVVASELRETYSFFGAHVSRTSRRSGVFVERVSKGSVFEHVLERGDRIVGFGAPPISRMNDIEVKIDNVDALRTWALRIPLGVKIALVFERRGEMYPYAFLLS